MTRRNIVFLTGAGISAESGLDTFRGPDGLWTNYEWVKLATINSLKSRTQECLDFYNWRRKQLSEVEPNEAHRLIAELEKIHNVTVITQNVDNLHERAGSSRIIHLHGELTKVCSSIDRDDPFCIDSYPLTTPIRVGDKASDGSQLRPYIVMFGEQVDYFTIAMASNYIRKADVFVVIGTSLSVYPAASLIYLVQAGVSKYVIDPCLNGDCEKNGFKQIKSIASDGMKALWHELDINDAPFEREYRTR